jgi:hypothetical protein
MDEHEPSTQRDTPPNQSTRSHILSRHDGPRQGPSRRLIWQREASINVTYMDGGVEDTFAPELVRTDQVTIREAGARVVVGEVVIHFADDAYITPGEAR